MFLSMWHSLVLYFVNITWWHHVTGNVAVSQLFFFCSCTSLLYFLCFNTKLAQQSTHTSLATVVLFCWSVAAVKDFFKFQGCRFVFKLTSHKKWLGVLTAASSPTVIRLGLGVKPPKPANIIDEESTIFKFGINITDGSKWKIFSGTKIGNELCKKRFLESPDFLSYCSLIIIEVNHFLQKILWLIPN